LNPAKTALFLWELPAKNMERTVIGTLVDDFLEIRSIIGDIIFMGLLLLITFYTASVREKGCLLGHC
jgi:hypothetical protein